MSHNSLDGQPGGLSKSPAATGGVRVILAAVIVALLLAGASFGLPGAQPEKSGTDKPIDAKVLAEKIKSFSEDQKQRLDDRKLPEDQLKARVETIQNRSGGSGDRNPRRAEEPQNNCPTTLWTIPLEIKGLACLLLLPKPEKQGDNSGNSSGGLLG